MRNRLGCIALLFTLCVQLGCANRVAGSGAANPSRAKPDMPTCESNSECRWIKVYASVGSQGQCDVHMLFDRVKISPGLQPKVVWAISPDDHTDQHEYRFKFDQQANPVVYGVDILLNDPATDFKNPGLEASGLRFRWFSVHGRPKWSEFDYVLKVERRDLVSGLWVDCTLVDPKIVNE